MLISSNLYDQTFGALIWLMKYSSGIKGRIKLKIWYFLIFFPTSHSTMSIVIGTTKKVWCFLNEHSKLVVLSCFDKN